MTDIRSSGVRTVRLRRWAARLLSILWAYWAVFWTWFVFAHFYEDAGPGLSVFIGVVECVVILLFLGAPIIASVWQMEELGGRLLKAIGVLVLAFIIVLAFWTGEPVKFLLVLGVLFFFPTMILPPWVAGYLFLACHRRSKLSGE